MSPVTQSARTWRLKIEALLLPTPLAGLDPEGEAAREAELRRLFALAEPDKAARDLLAGARSDAGDAQDAGAVPPGSLAGLSPVELMHPLDPKARWQIPEQGKLEEDWRALVKEAAKRSWRDADLAESYRWLWWTFVGKDSFQQLPHSNALADHSLAAHRSLAAAIVGARADEGEAALLLAQTGPVQETIEASRRTSDLWVGSLLYSYLSYQALKVLCEALGPDCILSPHPRGLPIAEMDLFRPYGDAQEPLARVQPALPAKVLAVVPAEKAGEIADRVSDAMLKVWQKMGEAARGHVDELRERAGLPPGWDEGFNLQMKAFLERAVVALPWPDRPAELHRFLQTCWSEDGRWTSAGALYGPMSGVLWRLSSAVGRAAMPSSHVGDARPKCTVCGEREQMSPLAPRGEEIARRDKKSFWAQIAHFLSESDKRESVMIKDGEGLCAPCLTRRFAPQLWFGESRRELKLDWDRPGDRPYLRFPSVASIATAPFAWWVAENTDKAEGPLQELLLQLQRLHEPARLDFTPPGNLLPGLGDIGLQDPPRLSDYEGSWLDLDAYEPERAWRDARGRAPPTGPGADPDEVRRFERLRGPLQEARVAFSNLCRALGAKPGAYYAVLYLDGDEMSQWLNGAHKHTPKLREVVHPTLRAQLVGRLGDEPRPVFPALQGELSRRLSGLAAGEVATIVGRHLGRLVYCGGDDVLALLPLHTVFPCADAIYHELRRREALGSRVTASAGICVAHMRDPLGPVLRRVRELERKAKKAGRDRLCVAVETRSGAPLELLLPWRLAADGPQASATRALLDLAALPDRNSPSEAAVSIAFGYLLRDESHALRDMPDAFRVRLEASLRKRLDEKEQDRLAEHLRLPLAALDRGGVDNAVNTILLARFLAREARGVPLDRLMKAVRSQAKEESP